MLWKVRFAPAFELEFDRLSLNVQDEILAQAMVLEEFGPALGRPRVGSLRQSWHANMNELRFNADNGVWRVAFVFDTNRQAVLLAAGSKSGVSERLFYRELIGKADDRFHRRLVSISKLDQQAWAEGKSPLIPLFRKGETLGKPRFEIVI